MELLLNDVLNLSDKDIESSRSELNMTEGSGGIAYIDKWLSLMQDEKDSDITDCSYWGWYENKKISILDR